MIARAHFFLFSEDAVKAEWGISTSVRLPSGGEIGLYQPTHRTMIEVGST
jgi:hypothetical protein